MNKFPIKCDVCGRCGWDLYRIYDDDDDDVEIRETTNNFFFFDHPIE